MPILTNKELSLKVADFLNKTSMSKTTFGKLANNDSRFVFDLSKNRNFSEKIKKKILSFIKNYKKTETPSNPQTFIEEV